MGIYVNPGNNNFKNILASKIYVDKTGILEYINSVLDTEERYICSSRPRRFGKTITADMLAAYYGKGTSSEELFKNLKISGSPDFKTHLNKYYVIQADMNNFRFRRDIVTGKPVTALQSVALFHSEIISELQELFNSSVSGNEKDLPDTLAKINKDTGAVFIIIIDEWDTIFREDKSDIEAQERYIELLRGLFKNSNSKKFVKLAYITGILPIKKYGTQSALNNFDEFSMVMPEPLEEYVGFTEEEVKQLCIKYNMDFDRTKQWYDGYILGNSMHIYNPKSVKDSIRRKRIACYWTRTETYESLKNYICMDFDGLKEAVIKMLAGSHIKINPDKFQNDMSSFKSKDDIMTLLIHLGYLAYDSRQKEVYIPNEEVKSEFKNAIEGAGWDSVARAVAASEKLLQAVWRKDGTAVAKGIDEVHTANTSILSYNDENSLSCVISLAFYSAINEYTLIREMPSGKGYADIIFLPRKNSCRPAMVIELKYNKSAKGAIGQIKEKKYTEALKDYQGNVLLVGINYNRKTKLHECCIESILKTDGQ